MASYLTPGVFVEEITSFPPSVVAVETAIPAFIGYTDTAVDGDGNSLGFIPTRIASLLEFQSYFGGDFVPTFQVTLGVAPDYAVTKVVPINSKGKAGVYYLYGSLRLYFANGGGPCYIVSVGSYSDQPALGEEGKTDGLLPGLACVKPLDEPTLLVFPDGVSLASADLGALQVAALQQCDDLQDRFVIMDLRQVDSTETDPISDFRNNVGMSNLKYGAAYYPWVRPIYKSDLQFRQLSLVDAAGTKIPDATVEALSTVTATNALVFPVLAPGKVVDSVNISAMAGTSPLTLNRDNFARLQDHFRDLRALLSDTTTDDDTKQKFSNLLLLVRAIVLAFNALQDSTLNLPAILTASLTKLSTDTALTDIIIKLIAYERNTSVLNYATRTDQQVLNDYNGLDKSAWIEGKTIATGITADPTVFTGAALKDQVCQAADALRVLFDQLAPAILSLFSTAEVLAGQSEQSLFENHPVFRDIAEQAGLIIMYLPASGAVAGVYAAVDRTRGVWKAPANVSLAEVIGPAVKINDQDQASLNVTSTGKSVNAIRAFTGKGTLIWGARTLAGNDNEWRYIPVRRFFIMAEESIKKATEPFVFEPNDRGTWVRVRAMIENFLTVQWRQGALAGAVPQQAFYVKVGLGETMSAQDILEGQMVVEVGMAVVRPAEFIILRFTHMMQTS